MFSIHYVKPDGSLDGQLAADDCTDGSRPWESRHATTARRRAAVVARFLGQRMAVVRGDDRIAYIIEPDGRRSPPANVEVAERARCVRDSGRPCFCLWCRADRRAERRADA